MTTFDELFGTERVMVILRGLATAEQAVAAANRAWEAGVSLVEVPIETPEQVPALRAVVAAGAERGKFVGAGTVTTSDQVRVAAEAGARYTVAPGLDSAVLADSITAGMPHLPGVATPTEVHLARREGCQWVKVFPANILGAAWFRALRGPFPNMRFLATGGISLKAAPEYLDAGARIVGFGAAAVEPERLTDLGNLTVQVRRSALGTGD